MLIHLVQDPQVVPLLKVALMVAPHELREMEYSIPTKRECTCASIDKMQLNCHYLRKN
jgi:hypothetical protein